jgi:DNA-directed RNA polymerase specialized sigma24 family protein
MTNWELTEESFNLFLSWLSKDPDTAGKRYEDIRRRLIIMLNARGCSRSAEVADEAINRFIRRLPELIESYTGDPVPYLCVIARNVHREILKTETVPLGENGYDAIVAVNQTEESLEEQLDRCLQRCLSKLESRSRQLVLIYYQHDKQAKIDFRKRLAKAMGIGANALRIRVHRIRATLEVCLNDCLRPEARTK